MTFLPERHFHKAFKNYTQENEKSKGNEYFQNNLCCHSGYQDSNSHNCMRLCGGAVPYGGMMSQYPFFGHPMMYQPNMCPVANTPCQMFTPATPKQHKPGCVHAQNSVWSPPPISVAHSQPTIFTNSMLSFQHPTLDITKQSQSLTHLPNCSLRQHGKKNRGLLTANTCTLPHEQLFSPQMSPVCSNVVVPYEPESHATPNICSPHPGVIVIGGGPESPPVIIVDPRATSTPISRGAGNNLSWNVTRLDSSTIYTPNTNTQMKAIEYCKHDTCPKKCNGCNHVCLNQATHEGIERGSGEAVCPSSNLISFSPEGQQVHAIASKCVNASVQPDYLTSSPLNNLHQEMDPGNLRQAQLLFAEYFQMADGAVTGQAGFCEKHHRRKRPKHTRKKKNILEAPLCPPPTPPPFGLACAGHRGQGQKHLRF